MRSRAARSGGGAAFFKALVVLLLVPAAVAAGVATFRAAPAPDLALDVGLPAIGRRTPVTVTAEAGGRGLTTLTLELVQGDRVERLLEKAYSPRRSWAFWGPRTVRDQVRVEVGKETVAGLKAGEAVLRARAGRAGTWLRRPDPVVLERTVTVRLTPPTLSVLSTQHYVAQGGCEVVVYRVGPSSARDGVRAGDWWFRGYPLPGGGAQDRFAFFAVPYDLADASRVRLLARDDVGNEAEAAFVDQFSPRPFHRDTIQLTDAFIGKVVPEILAATPDLGDRGRPLESFLAINRDLRKRNGEALRRLADASVPRFLWSEPFLALAGGQVMASFADRRTYFYEGREVDRQDHLGFDLATTQHAPIPAANRGIVVLAEYFGIFGNAVVLDHGYGLMSLYAHLSSIDVSKGQEVARGQTIGRSGETGLAGGDHLHFTVLLQGLPVTPVEWWDGHWIHDRLARKLGSALPLAGAVVKTAGGS